ncbi:unnamed protein product [Camellia sinensis]
MPLMDSEEADRLKGVGRGVGGDMVGVGGGAFSYKVDPYTLRVGIGRFVGIQFDIPKDFTQPIEYVFIEYADGMANLPVKQASRMLYRYNLTFAPVAKMNSVRVFLSLASNLDWPLHQFDVKNAFLHGDLEEEVYIDIPPGFEDVKTIGKVYRLRKSLYGLKQSPRDWFERCTQAMLQYGFKQSQADHTLFVKHFLHGKTTTLIVYVDDIVFTGDDVEEVPRLKEYLANEFEIKDLGSLKYFLGIEVALSKVGIFICQRKYVLDLQKETGMLGSKAYDTPLELGLKLCEDQGGKPVDRGRYQRLVETKVEKEQYLHMIKHGHLDIIVGTHSLLGSRVVFNNLGLLVVDEEHVGFLLFMRFGVKQKEKIASFKTSVDVLTLSATPILRTLYLALTGFHDASSISTSPPERVPIRTHLSAYSKEKVISAINYELDRGGQVFSILPRIKGLEEVMTFLEQSFPNVKIVIAHGK